MWHCLIGLRPSKICPRDPDPPSRQASIGQNSTLVCGIFLLLTFFVCGKSANCPKIEFREACFKMLNGVSAWPGCRSILEWMGRGFSLSTLLMFVLCSLSHFSGTRGVRAWRWYIHHSTVRGFSLLPAARIMLYLYIPHPLHPSHYTNKEGLNIQKLTSLRMLCGNESV